MHLLGFRTHQAQCAAQRFLRHDEERLHKLDDPRGAISAFEVATRQRIADLVDPGMARDAGWDVELLRADAQRMTQAQQTVSPALLPTS